MDLRSQIQSVAIGIATVFGLGFGAYLFIVAVIDKLNSVSGDLSKALIAGGIAICTAVATLVLGKIWERKLQIQQHIRERKIPVYEEQIRTFFGVLFESKFKKPDDTNDPEALAKAFVAFSEKLVIWGGPDVIKAWCEFRSNDWETSTHAQSLAKLETFIKAVRKELGNANKSLDKGELLRLFINDYDESIAKKLPQQSDAPKSPVR
jgi:hypothetical protein